MSENDFDNRIREKLDSWEPDYNPDAWDKLKKRMPLPWYVNFFKTYGGWIFGSISTLALLFNLNQNRFDKTNTLTEQPVVVETLITERDTVFRVDTVYKPIYITQYIEKPSKLEQSRSALEHLALKETELSEDKGSKVSEEEYKEGITEKVDLVSNEDVKGDVELSDSKAKKTIIKDTVASQPVERSIAEETKNKFWRNLNIRPGVEVDYSWNNSFSFGPIAEVLLKNRFSITTGISISNSSPSEFPLPKEFNKQTGKDFDDKYKPQKPPHQGGGQIKDISIQTSRIRMPLYMSYYVPITYRLNFLISSGTRLDLKVTEDVSYTNDGFTDSPYKSLESTYKPKIFNNLFYGMGVQYKYGRVYGQISPYFEFPFSKPSYVLPNNKFGINAALKFSLK